MLVSWNWLKQYVPLTMSAAELERRLILQSLKVTGGNKKRAAGLLHLKRTTFVEKLKRINPESELTH